MLRQPNSGAPWRFVFDHVPKTGGTSIVQAFEAALGAPNGMNQSTFAHNVAMAHSSSRFISGHLWYHCGERLADDAFYATLLREPIDRFLSQFAFQRRHRLDEARDPVTRAAISHDLADFLDIEDGEILRSYTNVQACHFATRLCDRPQELSEANLLDGAKTSLGDYDLVGCFDELQPFFDAFCRAAGVSPQVLPRLNAAESRQTASDLPAALREKLAQANRVDAALLRWLKGRPAREGRMRRIRRRLRRANAPQAANFGTLELKIVSAEVFGADDRLARVIAGDSGVMLRVKGRALKEEPDLTVGMAVLDARGETVLGFNSKELNLKQAVRPGAFSLAIEFAAALPPGDYSITLALHRGVTHTEYCYHWWTGCARFSVGKALNSARHVESHITLI